MLVTALVVTVLATAHAGPEQSGSSTDQRIRELETAVDEKPSQGNLYRLGNALLDADQPRRARAVFDRLLAKCPPDGKHFYPVTRFLVACCRKLEEYDAALAYLRDGLASIEQRGGDPVLLAEVAGHRAQVFLDMGLPDVALEEWRVEQAHLDRSSAEGEAAPRPAAQLRLANIRLSTDRYETAVKEIDAYFAAHPQQRATRKGVALLVRRGIAETRLVERGGSFDPVATFLEALSVEAESDFTDDIERVSALLRLADLFAAAGRFDEAASRLASARESIGASDAWRMDRAFALSVETDVLIGRRASRAELEAQRDELRREFEAFVVERQNAALRKTGVGYLRSSRVRRLIGSLLELAVQLETKERAALEAYRVVARLHALGTLSRELSMDSAFPTLATLRTSLVENEAALIYFVAPRTSYVIAVDRTRSTVATAPGYAELQGVRRDLLQYLFQSPYPLSAVERTARAAALRSLGQALGDLLLPNELRWAVGGRATRSDLEDGVPSVVIVGLDLLGYTPFELLRVNGEELGLTHAVRYLPSLSLLRVLGDRAADAAGRRRDVLLVTAPDHTDAVRARYPSLPPIPLDRGSAASVAPPRRASHWDYLVSSEARFDRLASALERVTVAQFLLHGVHDPQREVPASLILSGDAGDTGLVDADRLGALAMPPVVVFTVCSSGRGLQRWGDAATTDLSGVAFRGGAHTVLLPYSKLDYDATLALSRMFHDQLAAGASPSVALLHARRFVAGIERFDDPYYYALLHLHGLGNRPHFDPPLIDRDEIRKAGSSRLYWLFGILGIAVMVIGGVIALRRRVG